MINQVKIKSSVCKARTVLDEIGIEFGFQFGLKKILYARDVDMILSKNINGSDARISFKGNKSIVTIDNKIIAEKRKNFIMAHELGHFELHKNILEEVHLDDYNSLNAWLSGGHHEIEANYFAGELLMPKTKFQSKLLDNIFSFETLINLSNFFGSSITSSAIQFCKYGNYPICLVNSVNGIINWSMASEDFPLNYIENGDKLSAYSVAGEMYYGNKKYQEPQKIESSSWFSKDFKFEEYENIALFEQCFKNSFNSITSIIWTP